MDREAELLKGEIDTTVNTTATNEHVLEIEQRNWLIK